METGKPGFFLVAPVKKPVSNPVLLFYGFIYVLFSFKIKINAILNELYLAEKNTF